MNDKEKIEQLLGKLTEVYQDVSVKGEIVSSGRRECPKRFDLVGNHIEGSGKVILDVGSSLGFFAIETARRNPSSLVVSFESHEAHCDVQRAICEAEGLYNVIICNHRLSAADLRKLAGCAECIDLILLMSVLHHFPEGEAAAILELANSLAGTVVAEFPDPDETKLCGAGTVKGLQDLKRGGVFVGESECHLEDKTRSIYEWSNTVNRLNLESYMGVSHEGRHKFSVSNKRGGWEINGKRVIPGLNVWSLLHWNVVWPKPAWWETQAISAYYCMERKSDVRPWNLLATATGLKAIDYTTEFPPDSPASFHEADMIKLRMVFEQMKPENLWT